MLDVEFHLITEIAVALLLKPYYFVVLLKEPVITVFYKVRCTVIFKHRSEGMFSIREIIFRGVSPCDASRFANLWILYPSIHH